MNNLGNSNYLFIPRKPIRKNIHRLKIVSKIKYLKTIVDEIAETISK
jgi:hypothetical protein